MPLLGSGDEHVSVTKKRITTPPRGSHRTCIWDLGIHPPHLPVIMSKGDRTLHALEVVYLVVPDCTGDLRSSSTIFVRFVSSLPAAGLCDNPLDRHYPAPARYPLFPILLKNGCCDSGLKSEMFAPKPHEQRTGSRVHLAFAPTHKYLSSI